MKFSIDFLFTRIIFFLNYRILLYFLAFKAKTFITFLTLFLWTSTVFYFILSYLILAYLILSYLIYSHLFLSNLFLSNLDFAFASLIRCPGYTELMWSIQSRANYCNYWSLRGGKNIFAFFATRSNVLCNNYWSTKGEWVFKNIKLQYKLVRKIQCDYFFILL